jgi:hypothetical protein
MRKPLVAIAVGLGLAFLVIRVRAQTRKVDWAKKFEAMPDNAPPKWLFRNISAIRENTERIIQLLEGAPPDPDTTRNV